METPKIIKRSGNQEIQTDKSEQRTVFRTKDYGRFQLAPENREINQNHVEKLKTSITQYGFLTDCPIHVIETEDKHLLITDGQHRFYACRELGIEVAYILKIGTDLIRDIRVMHAYNRGWKDKDYLHHFVKQGLPSYEFLDSFIKEFEISIYMGLYLLLSENRGTKHLTGAFRLGEFVCSESSRAEARRLIQQINAIRFFHPRLGPISKDRSFLMALVRLVSHPQYDHERMLTVVEKQVMSFVKCANIAGYMKQLTEVFNFRLTSQNRIDFEKTQPQGAKMPHTRPYRPPGQAPLLDSKRPRI